MTLQNPHKYFKWLLLATIIVLFAIGISSCMTQSKIDKICANCPQKSFLKDSISVKDTSFKKESIRTYTNYINVPGPIVYMPNPCADLCDSMGRLKPFFRTEKKNGITSTLKTVGNVLVNECKADSMAQIITEKETEITHLKEILEIKNKQTVKAIIEYRTTRWEDFWIRSGQIIWFILLILGLYKGLKRWTHLPLP